MFSKMSSGLDIGESITQIQLSVSALDRKSSILREGSLLETRDLVRKGAQMTQSELRVIRQQVLDVKIQIPASIQQSSREIKDEIDSTENNIIREVQDTDRRAQEHASELYRGMTNMMCEGIRLLQLGFRQEIEYIESKFDRARTPQVFVVEAPILSFSELQSILCAPLQTITRDFEQVLRNGLQLDQSQQAQLQWVLQQERFSQWFRPGDSDFLLMYGNPLSLSNDSGRISSLSVVCATVMASLSQNIPGVIGLYYFCGLHHSSIDDLRGPQGLIRCLIARLLVEFEANSSSSPRIGCADAHFIKGLQRRDVRSLCDLFSSIVMLFSINTTIYFMIDGIAWYEGEEMLDGLLQVIQTLCRLVGGQGSKCRLKVLITSPFRPKPWLSSIGPEAHVMEVPFESSISSSCLGFMPSRMFG